MEAVTGEQRLGRICGLVTTLILGWSTWRVGAVVNPTDLSTLNALSSVWGANSLGWKSGDPCVDGWQGVGCDASNTQVKRLILTTGSVVGTIPSAIGSFTGLDQLDLSFNPGLRGSIPFEIGQLTTLTSLVIQACNLTGPIPTSLGNLKNLTFLALNNNQLMGEIPSILGGLLKVTWFDLSTNKMTGQLPVSSTSGNGFGLDTMESCEHFHLNNNSFSGVIPSELGAPPGGVVKLTKLMHLLLESNQLNGSIPESLGNITSLQIVSLSNNLLSGPIPTSLNRLAIANGTLQQLLVGHNQLNGTIPDLTAVTAGLQVVDLSYNLFDPHPFPAWLQKAPLLQTLYLESSNIVGNFSEAIFAIPNLQTLWARDNALNGTLTIPSVIESNLSVVSLENNQIDNLFVRNLTVNLASTGFKLAGNPVCAASFPFRPSSACDGADAGKSSWTFAGTINPCGNQSCSSVTATHNLQNAGNCDCVESFTVLMEVRRPTFAVFTDALMAKLRQYVYEQLNLLPMQVMVDRASFTPDGRANIYIDFFNADGKSELDRNSVTNITHSFGTQTLVLPEFKPYIASHVISGTDLLASKSSFGVGAISGIVLGALVVIVAIGVYAICQKRRAQRMKHITQPFAHWGVGGEKDVAAPQIAGARWFSFAEVKRVTNNFAAENEIGEGGYGKVYSGILATGERVAVKRAQENSIQGAEEFKNEIELLSRVHHKNLLGLVGYCYDQGEQMLVYELMANGTMREWLSGTKAYPLDWSKRLSIAIGSARGLTYLHESANPPIIHRDIKSSNILLSDTHIAKVADFGLSKVAPDGDSIHVSTTQVKGTLGYLDPEYYMTNQLSEKSDVYSYGVVLLELLTSEQPLSHGKYIVREVQRAFAAGGLEDGVAPLLDPCVLEASAHHWQRMVELALGCVMEKGEDRPSMNEVVKVLECMAEQNKCKAKKSAWATEETWLHDVYGEEEKDFYLEEGKVGEGIESSFLYSGGYTPQNPVPK